jgi:hypothetical protein
VDFTQDVFVDIDFDSSGAIAAASRLLHPTPLPYLSPLLHLSFLQ